ncbi:MAG: hypothetical protein ACI9L6_001141 [Flavobacterium sp.]|jgi:hypothetical protein
MIVFSSKSVTNMLFAQYQCYKSENIQLNVLDLAVINLFTDEKNNVPSFSFVTLYESSANESR